MKGKVVEQVTRDELKDDFKNNFYILIFAFLVLFVGVGIVLSFGYFQESYLMFGYSKLQIAFIGSTQLSSIGLLGMLSGRLVDRFGPRLLCFIGAIIMALGLFSASFATKYYQILLFQGILYSIGCSLSYYPAITIIPQYFEEKKGLAMGI
jgi:nitrate/nitrite transporter NarK